MAWIKLVLVFAVFSSILFLFFCSSCCLTILVFDIAIVFVITIVKHNAISKKDKRAEDTYKLNCPDPPNIQTLKKVRGDQSSISNLAEKAMDW